MDPELLDVVLRFREGQRGEAVEGRLDHLLRPRLRRYFAHGPWPADEAEDLVQKTLARVYTRVEQLHEPERFYGWLFAIARNVRRSALTEWDARRRVEAPPDELGRDAAAVQETGGESVVLVRERIATVVRAIAALPPRQRYCLLLQVREELSYEEIAATLGLSPLTVRNHIAQARESLRRLVLEDEETTG